MTFRTKRTRVTLWTIQGLLAAVFLFAGGFKLALPLATVGVPQAISLVIGGILAVVIVRGRRLAA